jgi:1,4-alpha-glucan branching enzyme
MSNPSIPNQVKRASTKKVPFVVRIPGAKKVAVTGDFSRWTKDGICLKNGSTDKWETVLDLAPGRYEYRLIVDGDWRTDPDAKARIPNSFGTENCVLTIT